MAAHQFVAIGDITMDAFIRINDAEVRCDEHGKNCMLCVRFGDKIAYESVEEISAVGNAPNAAVAAARLGLSAAIVADIGADDIGAKDLASLKKDRVDTIFLSQHAGMKSNHHYVLWHGAERTILVKHEAYPYRLPNLGEPAWVYLSSLADHSLPYHDAIASYLEAHPKIKLAFQPGTFQMKLGVEKLKRLYARAEMLALNTDEARLVLGSDTQDVHALLEGIRALGPNIALITDGPKGAYASDGAETWFVPPYPDPKEPIDRTGAGDAFASTFAAALSLGKTLSEALAWAPINSMSVVQYVGAQKGLLSREKIEQYLKEAPQGYAPQRLV